ncbi:MAG: hypothetical protein ABSF87_09010 [Xanthobacteraceae bacterium]|jgi:cytoskeletal protein RodZ
MREDSDHFRHYVPLLRRIVIVVAVLAAIPVILWTITIFMRSYVGPPKLPTFRQLAASATVPLPRNASASLDSATQPLPPSEQSRLSAASSAAVPAGATPTDAPDAAAAPKGPLLGDRAPIGAANTPTGALRTAATSIIPADPKATEMPAAAAPADGAAPSTGALAAQQPAAASDPPADAVPAAEPLSGPIPLPPRRPHLVAMAQMTPATVPMPRPRPDAAGPAASDSTTARPFDWLQNMFRKNSE